MIVFKKGEDFIPALKRYFQKHKIKSASFFGLGGFLKAELAFYELKTRKYTEKKFDGPFEVPSLIGNLAQADGKDFMHIHAVLGKKNFQAFGGHLLSATVGGTLELTIIPEAGLTRKLDKGTGLRLLNI